ncbi:MAG: signal recognition particle protein [Pedosphaera sp.]|nr:signal recognition particle protein [Pedosphaera sp.]
MFDALSDKLQKTFRNLRGIGKISETNVTEALREVRMALLDADVNFKVAKQFIARVKEKSLGEEVVASIQPGQQIVKIISDEMVALLGTKRSELDLPRGFAQPLSLMMCGLHGSGKTTSSGKLARLLAAEDRKTLLVGADVYRPAAMDQIETLARQLDLPCFLMRGEQDVLKIADGAMAKAKADGIDVVIFDTAGRLQIDEPLVQELVQLRDRVQPREILLVLDSATGQEAVSVATHFDEALGITGAILTKLDGDARGGAALSFREVTGKPIKFAGTGEKLDDFEPFHPDRMASRILGMGDVVSLVEKAAEAIDEETALKLEERMKKGHFTLEDFLDQLRQIKKLGSLESIVEMLPGGGSAIKGSDLDKGEKEFRQMEAMICSMTPQERRAPVILNARRRRRIAAGSGTTVAALNSLLKRFGEMQKMMKKMGKFQKMMAKMGGAGAMPGMGKLLGR